MPGTHVTTYRLDQPVCALKALYDAAGILPADGLIDLTDPAEDLAYVRRFAEPTDLAAPLDISAAQATELVRRLVVQIREARA